jgi:hypothetical protein
MANKKLHLPYYAFIAKTYKTSGRCIKRHIPETVSVIGLLSLFFYEKDGSNLTFQLKINLDASLLFHQEHGTKRTNYYIYSHPHTIKIDIYLYTLC